VVVRGDRNAFRRWRRCRPGRADPVLGMVKCFSRRSSFVVFSRCVPRGTPRATPQKGWRRCTCRCSGDFRCVVANQPQARVDRVAVELRAGPEARTTQWPVERSGFVGRSGYSYEASVHCSRQAGSAMLVAPVGGRGRDPTPYRPVAPGISAGELRQGHLGPA